MRSIEGTVRVVLGRADVRVMLWHVALCGLAAILECDGKPGIRVSWTSGMQPRARLDAAGRSLEQVGAAVRDHAAAHAVDSWVQQDVLLKGTARGLMSPRLTPFENDVVRADVQGRRHTVLDDLTAGRAWLDLRFLAALGEPAYWSHNPKGEPLQDDGASRLEMQPRNQGSEFVGSRLRKLAATVARRSPEAITDGLTGRRVRDEAERDKPESRTPTGFAGPGPTDNAVAWCALWGISQLPIAARVNGTAVTSGHLGRTRQEWFYLPYWTSPWRPARLRSVLADARLRIAATAALPPRWAAGEADRVAARTWLAECGVEGVVRFPIERFGTDQAPERRAMNGAALPSR